jgi:hypothetical protein
MSFLSKYISPLLYKDTDCSKVTNVLLVDHYVKGYETVVKSANASTFAIGYFMKSQRSELLALLRRKFTKIQRIGIFFESSLENPKSFLQLQSLFSNNETSPYSPNVQFLIELIKEFQVSNIDFLACNTLLYPNWVNYFSILQSETGVIVGASNDATGNLKYGGDWVLESTQQNVEKTYFNKSIEYYQYVLDISGWAGVFTPPTDVAFSGQYMYVTNYFDGYSNDPGTTISRIDLTDINNPDICYNWLSGFEYPFSLAIDGNNLFVSNSDSIDNGGGENNISYISKVNVNTLDVSYHWLDLYGEFVVYTGINSGIAVDTNHYLYINDVSNSNIVKVNTQNVSDICYNWLTADMISPPLFSVVHGDYLYATNIINNDNCEGFLSRTKLSDGSTIAPWGDFFGFASFGIAISGNYIYISNLCSNTIYVLNLSDGTFVPESENWSNNISNEVGLPFNNRIYNNQIYVMDADSNYVGQYDLFVPPSPASYVSCLLEGTQVWTLDGYVPIESLKVGDSIRTNNYSIAVTKVGKWTVNLNSEKDRADLGKKMYKIPAGRFGATSDTFISHYHRILYYLDEECSSRGYDIPSHLGLEVASPVEFAVDGKYTLYHLQLAIGNHFVVNGGCMVEAWNPDDLLV